MRSLISDDVGIEFAVRVGVVLFKGRDCLALGALWVVVDLLC